MPASLEYTFDEHLKLFYLLKETVSIIHVGGTTLYINSSAAYTSNGNYIKTLTDSFGESITYNYNETKGTLSSLVDVKGDTTTYSYDSNLDILTRVSKTVDGQAVKSSYAYLSDRIKSITYNGFSYTFDYDSLGNNTSVNVGGQNLITNTYELKTGKLLKSTYFKTPPCVRWSFYFLLQVGWSPHLVSMFGFSKMNLLNCNIFV